MSITSTDFDKNWELIDECLEPGLMLGMVLVYKVAGGGMLLAALWRAFFSGAFTGFWIFLYICTKYEPLGYHGEPIKYELNEVLY